MSKGSDTEAVLNIYEENHNEETTRDLSFQGLKAVPELNNRSLHVLYLQNNKITTLPEDFFSSLPNLTWLDLRDNLLTDIPISIQHHKNLTHLLLQDNKLTTLPNELGSVDLKALQLKGNPLKYPPREIINRGVKKILNFLQENYFNSLVNQSQYSDNMSVSEDAGSMSGYNLFSAEARSYNSVIDVGKLKNLNKTSVPFDDKDITNSDEDVYSRRLQSKCPKLATSRKKTLPAYCQSSKYLKPLHSDSGIVKNEKIKQAFLKEVALKRHKELLATRDKVLQDRKTVELLKEWRRNYRTKQLTNRDGSYRLEPKSYPYDTSPEYMTLLSREDLEKDLPDKFKKNLVRRSKQTIPRKNNNDVHLAMKIKQLFENLEAVDLNREGMSPRSEQRVLLNEIQKISEIRQKLMELSTVNGRCVAAD